MNYKRIIILKKYLIIIMLAFGLSLLKYQITQAQEINPDPSTYSYGSTSEFSPYITLGQGSSNTLAPTGQSQIIGYVAIVSLLVLAAGTTYYLVRSRKHPKPNK